MMGAGLASRMRWSILCGVALMAIALGWVATASAATSDRILMHRNGLRGVSYQQLSVAGAPASSAQLSATKIRQFSLDGDGQTNVRANMYPIQVNGGWGFVHFNGYRIMRVFDSSGRKLWQITNPSGRVHRSWSHRDTLAIMGSSIVHCWLSNGQRILVKRDGRTGAVIKTAVIPGGTSSSECQIAAFNLADIGQPLIFVATKSATAKCKQNYEDTWSGTIAYDQNLNLKWRRDTCDAGHYVWAPEPTGTAVYNVMVGKYYVNSQGQILCTLGGGVSIMLTLCQSAMQIRQSVDSNRLQLVLVVPECITCGSLPENDAPHYGRKATTHFIMRNMFSLPSFRLASLD